MSDKPQGEDMVKFVLNGATTEGRPALMSMPRKQYDRVMPPYLMDAVEVEGTGNGDESCHVDGHSWGAWQAIDGHMVNGVEAECTICGVKTIRKWSQRRGAEAAK